MLLICYSEQKYNNKDDNEIVDSTNEIMVDKYNLLFKFYATNDKIRLPNYGGLIIH